MYDSQKVIAGLVIFILLVTIPVWYNIFFKAPPPELDKPGDGCGLCVVPKIEMKATHMQILNEWRDEVVRSGDRYYLHPCYKQKGKDEGALRLKSLSNGCLTSDCHASKANFCDKCHEYAGVTNYCWDCHIIPAEPKKVASLEHGGVK